MIFICRELISEFKDMCKKSIYYYIAKFHAVTEMYFYVMGVLVGFVLFFLPVVSVNILGKLKGFPLLYSIFDQVTRLHFSVVLLVLFYAVLALVLQKLAALYRLPGVYENGKLPTGKSVYELYKAPYSVPEKVTFISWAILKVFNLFVGMLPFVFLAYFIRIGDFK